MNIFTKMYEAALRWSTHRLASVYLFFLSFFESIFFPVPPDVMLAPMALSAPQKAWRYAAITSIASLLGGIIGYWLGYFLFEPIVEPMIQQFSYQARFDRIVAWFSEWGIWVVFLAGFSPIPYKLFTVTAGLLNMAFIPFVIASAISRSLRFYLVAGLVKYFGATVEAKLKRYIDVIGWGLVLLVVLYMLFAR